MNCPLPDIAFPHMQQDESHAAEKSWDRRCLQKELWDSTGPFHVDVSKFRDVQAVHAEHQRTRAVVRMYSQTKRRQLTN